MSHRRKEEDKHRLKKLYNKTHSSYGAGAYYDNQKERYIRYSCHNERIKTHCRRITRRRLKREEAKCNNCTYKKMYDYWWEIT